MTLVLKNIPLEIDDALRKRAEELHQSVDQTAVDAMKAGLGLGKLSAPSTGSGNLATAIRSRFALLGGLELPQTVRELVREPAEFRE
jgi:hypothetical protein